MNDFPMIQCKPTPSDAELEAERDVKHAAAVREWFNPWCVCGHRFDRHRSGRCLPEVMYFYGAGCACEGFAE